MNTAHTNAVLAFAKGEPQEMISGSKLFALLRLADIVGEPVTTDDPNLNGLKALTLRPGLWVAFRKTEIKVRHTGGPYYQLNTYLLQSLNP